MGPLCSFYDIYPDKVQRRRLSYLSMPPPKRINLPCCVYHIICRENRNDAIFVNDKNKEKVWENGRKTAEQRMKKGLSALYHDVIRRGRYKNDGK